MIAKGTEVKVNGGVLHGKRGTVIENYQGSSFCNLVRLHNPVGGYSLERPALYADAELDVMKHD